MEEIKEKVLENIKNGSSDSDSDKSENKSWENAENEFDIIHNISDEEIKHAKSKMKRSIGSRFVGFFKKIVTKTKDTMSKQGVQGKNRAVSLSVNPYNTNLKLGYESDICNRPSESGKISLGNSNLIIDYSIDLAKASKNVNHHKVHKSNALIDEEETHKKVRMSTVNRPANLIEHQMNDHQEQMKNVLNGNLNHHAFESDSVEDITDQIAELDGESDSLNNSQPKQTVSLKKESQPEHNQIDRNSMKVAKKKNVNEFAIDLVDQMKFIIASEFNKGMNDDILIHYGITGSEGYVSPIKGVRYKCAIGINYNLGEHGEDNHKHEHLFIKIRRRDTKIPMLANLKNVVKANNKNKGN